MQRNYFNQMFSIENSYLTEIDLGAAPGLGSKIYFQDYPNLTRSVAQGLKFTGVEAYYVDVLNTSPNGVQLVSLAEMAKLTFVIAVGSNQPVYQVPATNLCTFLNGGFIRPLNYLQVNLVKSYVQVMSAGIAANRSICFNWYYEKPKK